MSPIQQMLLGVSSAAETTSGSVNLDGTGDYLSLASTSDLAFGTGDWTMEGWFYWNNKDTGGNGSEQMLFDYRTSGQGAYPLVFKNSNDNIRFRANIGSVPNVTIDGATIVNSVWYHIAACRSSGTTKLFINGVSQGSATDSVNYQANTFQIGALDPSWLGNYMFNGLVTNVRITKGQALYTSNFSPSTTALTTTSQGATSSNVKLLCCNSSSITGKTVGGTITAHGNPTISTATPFVGAFPPTAPLTNITNTKLLCCNNASSVTGTTTGTISAGGNPAVSSTQPFSGAASVEFDGSGDYLLTSSSSDYTFGTGDFTVEHWFRTDDWATSQMIDGRMYGSSYQTNWCTYIESGKTYRFFVDGDQITSSALADNTWYHAAVVRNSGTTTLYINGVSQGTYSDSNNYDNTQITVGAHGPNRASFPYDGLISDLRVVKGTAVY